MSVLFKNTASQTIALFAFDATTGLPKTGDAANMVFYITKDWGTVTAISANSGVPTEVDSTNAKGWYKIAVSQTESNADAVLLTGKSSTANISVVGRLDLTAPPNFTKLVIDANGLADANMVKMGPTGSGTAQTARDIGASVLLSNGTGTGQLKLASGYVAMTWADIASPTTTVNLSGTTIATVTNQLTAAAIAAGIWQDATAGDFTTSASIGKSIMNGVALGTGLTVNDLTTKTGFALSATGSAAFTEGYAADGAAATLPQMLYQIWSFLVEANLSGTTITSKKLDGSTTAMTFAVDSATAPTTITRAT